MFFPLQGMRVGFIIRRFSCPGEEAGALLLVAWCDVSFHRHHGDLSKKKTLNCYVDLVTIHLPNRSHLLILYVSRRKNIPILAWNMFRKRKKDRVAKILIFRTARRTILEPSMRFHVSSENNIFILAWYVSKKQGRLNRQIWNFRFLADGTEGNCHQFLTFLSVSLAREKVKWKGRWYFALGTEPGSIVNVQFWTSTS